MLKKQIQSLGERITFLKGPKDEELELKRKTQQSLSKRMEVLGQNEQLDQQVVQRQMEELARLQERLNEEIRLLEEVQNNLPEEVQARIRQLEEKKRQLVALQENIVDNDQYQQQPGLQEDDIQELRNVQERLLLDNDLIQSEKPKQTVALLKELFEAISKGVKEYKKEIEQINKQEDDKYQLFLEPPTEEEKRKIAEAASNNTNASIEERSKGNPYGYQNEEGESLIPSIDKAIKLDLINECDNLIEAVNKIMEDEVLKETGKSAKFLRRLQKIHDALTGDRAKQAEKLAQDIPNAHPYLSQIKDIALFFFKIVPLTRGALSGGESMLGNMDSKSNIENRQDEIKKISKELDKMDSEKGKMSKKLKDIQENLECVINQMKGDKKIGDKEETALIDEPFVKEMYLILLDHYLNSEAIKDKENPLSAYIRDNREDIEGDKLKLKNRILRQKLGLRVVVKKILAIQPGTTPNTVIKEILEGVDNIDDLKEKLNRFMRSNPDNTDIKYFLEDNGVVIKAVQDSTSKVGKDIWHYNGIGYEVICSALDKETDKENANPKMISVLLANIANTTNILKSLTPCKNEEVKNLAEKSINTIMMDVNDMLFDFESESNQELLNLVSEFPNKEGKFERSSHDKITLTKTGDTKYQDMMVKIENFTKDMEERKAARELGGTSFLSALYRLFSDDINYEAIDQKLVECLNKVMCALVFNDDGIMLDYIKEVRTRKEKDKGVRDLYNVITSNTLKDWFKSWFKTQQKWSECKDEYKLKPFLEKISAEAKVLDKKEQEESKRKIEERSKQERQEKEKEKARADKSGFENKTREVFTMQSTLTFGRSNPDLNTIIICNSQNDIVNAVVDCAMKLDSAKDAKDEEIKGIVEPIVAEVIKRIKFNGPQVIRDNKVSANLIAAGINKYNLSSKGTHVNSNVNTDVKEEANDTVLEIPQNYYIGQASGEGKEVPENQCKTEITACKVNSSLTKVDVKQLVTQFEEKTR